MKKTICIFLVLVTIFTMVACTPALSVTTGESLTEQEILGKTEAPATTEQKESIVIPKGFTAGFSRQIVNPDPGTALGGFPNPNQRLSKVQKEAITLSCLAVSDGENTLLHFFSDTIHVGPAIVEQVAKIAENEFGIPKDHVVMNATHTHSGPSLYSTSGLGMAKYVKNIYYPAARQAMDEALRDLKPVQMAAGKTEAKGMNYVRRYVSLTDGSFLGKNLSSGQDPTKVAHETEADSTLQVLRFERENAKDIVICNWQAHPCTPGIGTQTGDIVSSDWVHYLRETVEKNEDVHFAYMQGAAANVSNRSHIKGNKDWGSNYSGYGKELAKFVSVALKSTSPIQGGKVQIKRQDMTLDYSAAYLRENQGAKKVNLSFWALSLGDVGIATFPGELHDLLGASLREKSPFSFTLFSGYTNGTAGYFPAEFAFKNGGYEVNSARHEKGMSEFLVDELVKMLGELYPSRK